MNSLRPFSRDSRGMTPSHQVEVGLDVPGHGTRSPSAAEQSGGADLQRYLLVLRRRWRLVAAVVVVVVAAVGVGTSMQSPVYRASGLIELRGQSSEGVDVDALFQAQRLSNQFLETQYGMLRSTALAQRAMIGAGLLGDETVGAGGGTASAEAAMDVRDRVERFANGLVVDPVGGSNLVWVHYESSDPQLAARVVNAVFVSYTAMRAEAARAAVTRLAAEVDSVRGRLARAERELLGYARRSGLTAGLRGNGAEDLPHARLRILQQQLAEADADRYSKESLYDLVRRRDDGLLESEILQALNVRLATLRSDHARMRAIYLDEYPKTKELKAQIDEVEALLGREQGRLREAISSRYMAAVRRQQLLQQAVDEQRVLVDGLGERSAEYGIMAREVEAQQGLYARLQERLRAGEVSAAVAATDVSVVEAAVAPTDPVRPDLAANLRLALVVGLVLGVGLAFLREHVDVTVRTVEDLEALPVPVLGLIPSAPHMAARTARTGARQLVGRVSLPGVAGKEAAVDFEQRALRDAFLSLRTAVVLADGEPRSVRSLLVTSARPGDGKTTIAGNLALSLGQLGHRVLLVDADMRRPAVHRAFSMRRGRGLAEVLRGEAPWASVVHREVLPGLDLMLAGERLDAPTDLLSNGRVPPFLEEAREAYDCVIVDSPALGINAADTRILAALVDGVVMVVRSGTTPRALVGSLLRQAPNVVGVVLNDVDPRSYPAYYYAYGPEQEQAATV